MAARKHTARKPPVTETKPPIYPPFLQTNLPFNNFNEAPPCITKSWLPTTTRCAAAARQRPQLYHVIPKSSPTPNSIPNPYDHFVGDYSIIEAVYGMPDAAHWCLLKSNLNAKIHEPPTIPSNRFGYLGPPLQLNVVLSPNSPSSGLMVQYRMHPNHTYYYFGYNTVLFRHECTMADPFDAKRKSMEFTSVVECGGKFYAITLQGALVVMQVNDTRLKITAVGMNRAVPELSCRYFKEYLVVMKGEILLIYLIHGKSLANVDSVEIYRLDFVKLDMIKVERFPGNTLFLSERCIWVDSLEFGCRDDCVYFNLGLDNMWSVYDMKVDVFHHHNILDLVSCKLLFSFVGFGIV